MFGLTQYNGNGALMATTGFMLAPMASALSNREYSVSREEPILSIAPAEPSSNWGEWLTSGYVGDFLGWAGKQLAEVGSNIFPPPSKMERVQTMRADKREIKQFLSEKMWDEAVSADISATLNSYLRNGLVLMQMDSLDPEEWQVELMDLKRFSDSTGNEAISVVLSEWIDQLALLLKKKVSEERKKAPELNGPENEPKTLENYQREKSLSLSSGGSTIDLGALGETGCTINGYASYYNSGSSVSGAGDVNNDGFADVIIGTPSYTLPGMSYVVFGSKPMDNINLATLGTTKAGFTMKSVYYGPAVVNGAGDVNNDGFADVIIGDPGPEYSAVGPGMSYVVFGSNSMDLAGSVIDLATLDSTKAGFTIKGVNTGDLSGWSVSGAGDVNNDGFADVIIGAPSAAHSGVTYVVFGSNSMSLAGSVIDLATLGSTKAGFTITNGADSYYQSGASVSGAGDVNNDGFADVIIGAYQAPGDAVKSGVSYVVFGGNSNGLAGSTIDLTTLGSTKAGFTIKGVNANDISGSSVSGAGDVNNDGFADVIIGAPSYGGGTGMSYVVFGGNSTGLAGSTIDLATIGSTRAGFTIKGVNTGDKLGYSVSGAGDVNNDGFADVIVGAPQASGDGYRTYSGISYVVFGNNSAVLAGSVIDLATLSSSKLGVTINGAEGGYSYDSSGDRSGFSVSGAGDVNKDGIADVIIGAPYADNRNTVKSGTSYVVFGSTSPTTSATHFERNIIVGSVVAGGLLATGLFCFFYKKKSNNYCDEEIKQDERMLLNEGQSSIGRMSVN